MIRWCLRKNEEKTHIIIALIVIIVSICSCSGVSGSSTFSMEFIDVGQGDATLIECDKHYMLIDGGSKLAGSTVKNTLRDKGIQHLDILAISHLHEDHFGGLIDVLGYATSIDKTISNSAESNLAIFSDLEHELSINGTKISIPHEGDKFKLGSAEIEIIDANSNDLNDSLVFLVTFGDTSFLFTGDIEETAQRRITTKYQNEKDDSYDIDLIKMPHHGGKANILFMRTFMPEYAIISVGKNNKYGHPFNETLDMLDQMDAKVYRTDVNGNIIVKSDGKSLSIETSK